MLLERARVQQTQRHFPPLPSGNSRRLLCNPVAGDRMDFDFAFLFCLLYKMHSLSCQTSRKG